ncbi:MAG: hypothetical protein K6U74_12560 [Firmicutes bacterium]|nr:hypothetical protein [Bacillota bacterium]
MRFKIGILLVFTMICSMLVSAVPVFAATPSLQVTYVQPDLNGKQQLVPPGSSVTVRASAAGAVSYSFWVADPSNDMHLAKAWGSDNTLTLDNLQAGTYLIDAYALMADGTVAGKRETVNVGSTISLSVLRNGDGTYTAIANTTNIGSKGSQVVYAFSYTADNVNYPFVNWYVNADGSLVTSNIATIPADAKTVYVFAKDARAYLGNQGWETCVATSTPAGQPHVVIWMGSVDKILEPPADMPADYNTAGAHYDVGLVDSNGNILGKTGLVYTQHITVTGPALSMLSGYKQSGTLIGTQNNGGFFGDGLIFGKQPGRVTVTYEVEGFAPATYVLDYVPPAK